MPGCMTRSQQNFQTSGCSITLGRISKAGNRYLRRLLYLGAMAQIGTIPPAEAQARFHAQSEELAMVA